MYAPLKNLMSRYDDYMTVKGREEARRILMNKDMRSLEDMGISPYLLAQGVNAWPWRDGEVKPATATAVSVSRQQRKAIRELRSMSNAELSDLGITRGSIVDVVKHGRAVDQKREHAA